jgi:hypothetical protein
VNRLLAFEEGNAECSVGVHIRIAALARSMSIGVSSFSRLRLRIKEELAARRVPMVKLAQGEIIPSVTQ